MAGAGAYQSANTGSLSYYFAPILPYRHGTNHDDPAGTFKTDTITLMYVPPTMAQTTLATSGPPSASADIGVNIDGGCPTGDAACGFKNGMAALLFDASGDYDTFTITNVQSNVLHVERTGGSLTYGNYPPHTATLVQLASVLYYLKSDSSTGTYQLMSRDGATGAEVPVIDHLADDASENDDDPLMDGHTSTNPGTGVLVLRAEAFGPRGTHQVIELTVARPGAEASGVRVVSWRLIR
jgi:hypothetical protein